MTQDLFRSDSYQQACEAQVVALTEAGVVLDRTVFYPLGGGQASPLARLVRVLNNTGAKKIFNGHDALIKGSAGSSGSLRPCQSNGFTFFAAKTVPILSRQFGLSLQVARFGSLQAPIKSSGVVANDTPA